MDTVEVHNVLKIPAHKNIDLSNCRNSNVLSVCNHARRQRPLPYILLSESRRFVIQYHVLYIGRGDISQNSLHLIWRPCQLGNRHVGDYDNRRSGNELLHNSSRWSLELIVSATTDDGSVDVNT